LSAKSICPDEIVSSGQITERQQILLQVNY
jgi:hypothetical protein